MAKRVRGSRRPGQRAPLRRDAGRSTGSRPTNAAVPPTAQPVRPASSLTPEEEARAAELEAAIMAEERAAEQAARRSRDRGRPTAPEVVAPRGRSSLPLSVRAADEYAYVRRDVRRIARIGGLLLAVLAVLHVLINVMGLFKL